MQNVYDGRLKVYLLFPLRLGFVPDVKAFPINTEHEFLWAKDSRKETWNEALRTNAFTNLEIVCFLNFLVFSDLPADHLFLDYPFRTLYDASCIESSLRYENVCTLRLNFLLSLLLKVYDTNIALNVKTVNFVRIVCSSLDDWVGAINFNCSCCMNQMLPLYFDFLLILWLRHEVLIGPKVEDANNWVFLSCIYDCSQFVLMKAMPFVVSKHTQIEASNSIILSVDIDFAVLIDKYLVVIHDCHRFSLFHDNLAGLSLSSGRRRVHEVKLLLQVQPQLPLLLLTVWDIWHDCPSLLELDDLFLVDDSVALSYSVDESEADDG